MSHLTCVRFAPTVPAPCSSCHADRFTDPETGAAICPDCTAFVPTTSAPALTRDEAFAKVEKLLWWYANRYVRFGRAGFGTTVEEFFSEAALIFWRRFHTFDGNPGHLPVFTKYAVMNAAARLRRMNPQPVGVSLDTFDDPADLIPDREPERRLEPDDADRLRALLATLEPQQRDEVLRYFGAFGNRKWSLRELAERRGGSNQAAGQRIRGAVNRLKELVADRS